MTANKASRAKWALALTEMGFSKEQVAAALHECNSVRQAVEWLYAERDVSGELCMAALREAAGGNALSKPGPSESGTLVQGGAPEATSSASQADAKEVAHTPVQGAAPEATSSAAQATSSATQAADAKEAAQAADAKEAAQVHKVRGALLSPMWVTMSQRFKENVSALKSRQGRRPSMVSRRQSLKRGPGPSQIEQPLAPRKGRVSIVAGRVSKAGRVSIAGPGPSQIEQPLAARKGRVSTASRRQSLKRDSGGHISSRSLSSKDELPRELLLPEPQPLPTPEVARPQKQREEANQGEARRRSSVSSRQHIEGKARQKSPQEWSAATADQILDAVAQAPTPVAQAPAPEMPPCDYCAFRNKRLRSKTPEPGDNRCQRPKRKRLSRKSSPSVESGCLPARTSSCGPSRSSRSSARDAEQRKRPEEEQDHKRKRQSEGSASRTHNVKAYRVTWAWKLAEMGFSEEQIDAAISQCSTQREAIERLCNS